jgi:pyruvate dehydrogenase E2 component (dihydrolipoamide acetyltransferase)
MTIEVLLPQRGMGMREATIVRWFKVEGDYVQEGEPLVEVETSKVTEQIASPASGVISKIFYSVDEQVEVSEVLATIVPERQATATESVVPTPAVTKEEAREPEATPTDRLKLTNIRRRTAERMLASLHTTAQLTLHTEVDVTKTVEKREAIKSERGVTYTDIMVRVVAAALKNHPVMNGVWSDDSILLPGHINIGVAVAMGEGLLVPTIRNADRKSLTQIHAEVDSLTEKARNGTLKVEELVDGTFTISNLGMYRVDTFTPILNPPQTGILGVGRIIKKPFVVNDQIEIRSLMGLSLTFDHRVVDGASAASFLDEIAMTLEAAQF